MQRKRVLRSSWILNQCNLSCKTVKNCRIIGLNRAKKEQNSVYFETAYSRRSDSGDGAKRSEQKKKELGAGLGVRAPFLLSLSSSLFYFSHSLTSRSTPLSEPREQVNFETKTYRAFSLTWPASMQIHWNKRKWLHKKRDQLPQDWFGTPTWPPFYCFEIPIWSPWRHVKTLYYSTVMCKACQVQVTSTFSLLMLPSIPVDVKWHKGL